MKWMDDYYHDLFLCSTNNNLQIKNITKYSNPSILVKECKNENKKIEKLLKTSLHGMKQKLQE
jgi:hypothetical protein